VVISESTSLLGTSQVTGKRKKPSSSQFPIVQINKRARKKTGAVQALAYRTFDLSLSSHVRAHLAANSIRTNMAKGGAEDLQAKKWLIVNTAAEIETRTNLLPDHADDIWALPDNIVTSHQTRKESAQAMEWRPGGPCMCTESDPLFYCSLLFVPDCFWLRN
jgi:hypothetical protein